MSAISNWLKKIMFVEILTVIIYFWSVLMVLLVLDRANVVSRKHNGMIIVINIQIRVK